MTERIIYDCDNTMGLPHKEIDDGLTLLYLLGRPDVELLGVTTTFGNGAIGEVYPQTVQLLRRLGCADIPVYEGAGERGQAPTNAARFLAQTVASHPGEITLLATGPLGNLRAAAELDSAFFDNLKQIVCMGGYLHPLRIGWRNLLELNLSSDPEAAFAVLNAPLGQSRGIVYPTTLMNAHVCLQASFGWRDLTHIRHWGLGTRRVVRNWLLTFGLYCGVSVFYLWDLLPAVYVSHPELFDENPVWVRSTVTDLETGTLVLGDRDEGEGIRTNMPSHILNAERFKKIIFEAWQQTVLDRNLFQR
ncbi:MAG: nucleoside hydrolase [Chloroflexota bacterium]|nr:nucleoside hydrolase [Chloroflexota bacterium]